MSKKRIVTHIRNLDVGFSDDVIPLKEILSVVPDDTPIEDISIIIQSGYYDSKELLVVFFKEMKEEK